MVLDDLFKYNTLTVRYDDNFSFKIPLHTENIYEIFKLNKMLDIKRFIDGTNYINRKNVCENNENIYLDGDVELTFKYRREMNF